MTRPVPLVAGIDIGGTNTRVAVAHLEKPSAILARHSARTPKPGVERLLALAVDGIRQCLTDADAADMACMRAVGCTAPGMTDPVRGVVLDAANLPGWTRVPLASLLKQRLAVPTTVINDVHAAALAEAEFGAGTGYPSFVYMTISTGVAAGIVVNGQVLSGAHHCAGEIGNIIPDPVHLDRDWQPNGCLERTAAGMGLAHSWSALRGSPATGEEVFAAARQGDPEAVRLIRRATDYLAQAAVALGSIVDPARIILGGSIGLHQKPVHARIQSVLQSTLPCPPEVVPALLGDDAPLVGALLLATRLCK